MILLVNEMFDCNLIMRRRIAVEVSRYGDIENRNNDHMHDSSKRSNIYVAKS